MSWLLAWLTMSAIMTDMKTKPARPTPAAPAKSAQEMRDTFTVRDLNRQPSAVLLSAEKLGRVMIRGRDGRVFTIMPEISPSQRIEEADAFIKRQDEYRKKLRKMGFVPPSKKESEKLTRLIAGEE